MKRGHFAAAIIPVLAWAVALALTGGTAMAATGHTAVRHTAVQHTAVRHTAVQHTAVRHTAVQHTAVRHTAVRHTAVRHTAVRHTAVRHTAVRHTAVRAARHARAAAPTVVFDCLRGRVRPRSFILTCGDRNNYLTMLSWSAWSSAFASGTGTQMINDCAPDCAAGTFHRYPVDFVLWRSTPVPDHSGKRYFSRITVLYPGTRPPAYWHAKPQTGPETWTGTLAS